jgi:hypothetical protein
MSTKMHRLGEKFKKKNPFASYQKRAKQSRGPNQITLDPMNGPFHPIVFKKCKL